MFNFLKKIRNKDNTPKKGYNLSYDNLAIPEIHIKDKNDSEAVPATGDKQAASQHNQADSRNDKPHHKKTHVTYDGVAVPEVHFREKE